MIDRRKPTSTRGDCASDPLLGPMGCLDEPACQGRNDTAHRQAGNRRLIEPILIGFLLVAGLVAGIRAFVELFIDR